MQARACTAQVLHVTDATESPTLSFPACLQPKPDLQASECVHTAEDIPAGELLMEYLGEVVRRTIADVREKEGASQGIYFFAMGKDVVVDASRIGGIARYINHCCRQGPLPPLRFGKDLYWPVASAEPSAACSPNCAARRVEAEGQMRILILAAKQIHAGDELTYAPQICYLLPAALYLLNPPVDAQCVLHATFPANPTSVLQV